MPNSPAGCVTVNELTELDLSKVPNLTDLICDEKYLTELDVTANTALTELRCDPSVNVSQAPEPEFQEMNNTDWFLIDTETTGLSAPIFVVELAAQKMRGWGPNGEPFRRLVNQNADIPPEASRLHGYTREILERDGDPAAIVYRDFSLYVEGRPIVSLQP